MLSRGWNLFSFSYYDPAHLLLTGARPIKTSLVSDSQAAQRKSSRRERTKLAQDEVRARWART